MVMTCNDVRGSNHKKEAHNGEAGAHEESRELMLEELGFILEIWTPLGSYKHFRN